MLNFFLCLILVVAFAGDALICVFPDAKGVSRPDSCFRALQCAYILRNHESKATKSLTAHIAVSYGEMKMALLGGLHNRWVYLLNGSCVSDLSSCIDAAKSKQVVVTMQCYQQVL
jgi:hypothetical protein